MKELVNHPDHYASCSQIGREILKLLGLPESAFDMECDIVMAQYNWVLNAYHYNAAKYLWRLGKKDSALQDLRKARWNLTRSMEVFGTKPNTESAIALIDRAIEEIENGLLKI